MNGLPLGNYAKYAKTLFTRAATTIGGTAGVIKEGDRIYDATTATTYEVLNVEAIYLTNQFSHYICELLKIHLDASTWLKRSYTEANRDATTGWLDNSYTNETIYLCYAPSGRNTTETPIGSYTRYDLTAVTASTAYNTVTEEYDFPRPGDFITTTEYATEQDSPVYYEVQAAVPYLTQDKTVVYSVLYCVKKFYPRYVTGVVAWHTDSDSATTDPRSRMKVYLDAHLAVSDYQVLFSGFAYHLFVEYLVAQKTMLVILDKASATPIYNTEKKIIGFNETVPVTISYFGQVSYEDTAPKYVEDTEQDIRHILTDFQSNSFRRIDTVKHSVVDYGGLKLYSTTLNVVYERPNDDFTPTYPTVTWGPSASPTGTYTLPNVTDLKITMLSNNKRLTVPGRLGQWTQKLGLPDLQIDISSDLDIEPWSGDVSDTKISWKRPQTNGTKTDIKKWQVFADIQFNGELTGQTYQTLNLGYGTTMQVILDEVHVDESNGGHTLQLRFYGYNSVSATNYKTWFSINP